MQELSRYPGTAPVPVLLRTLTAVAAASALLAVPAFAQVTLPPLPGEQSPSSSPPSPPPPSQPPPPPAELPVGKPGKNGVREGQSGRLRLGGTWYFRLDDEFAGERERFFAQRSLQGWTRIKVPHNWNATDTTENRSSIGWYRREFRLPRPPRGRRFAWRLRFESVNHRASVWLNGRKLAVHAPGYFPFEVDLKGLRKGRNRLVVEVSTLRGQNDLTHWRVARFNGYGTGGWWNFGGISREVYVRRIDTVDVEDVAVSPRLRCVRCSARVGVTTRLRNVGRKKRRVALALTVRRKGFVRRISLRRTLGGRSTQDVRTSFTVTHPRLWRLSSPALYGLTVAAAVDGRRVGGFFRRFGVRQIKRLRDGRVLLNGRKLRLHGASIHEDDPRTGAALSARQRGVLIRRLSQLGATVVRAHHPLHPAFLEAFDRRGILYWSQAPVYQVPTASMANPAVREAAVRVNRKMVLRDRSHPSVLAWSIANELPDEEQPAQSSFVEEAAREVRKLDRTRLVAIDRQSQLGQPDPAPALQLLDAIGINDYFGWYNASLVAGRSSQDSDIGPFLDEQHRLYPGKAFFITEFGAESNRDGPDTEKGTHQFQSRWMAAHLAVYASKPWVNGAIAWILKDFRVHPEWGGGNPKPGPPWNNKGVIDEAGALKPAFFEVRRLYGGPRR